MASTTHAEFNAKTENLEVAKAFASEIQGKTIIVTGVNRGGIGFTTAQGFASQNPAALVIAGRNSSKIQECIDALKADYPNVEYRALKLDLGDKDSIRAAAKEALNWPGAVDILVNSAGIMGIDQRTLTSDGIEIHFATNHIGHFLFTNLIMPKLIKAAEGKPKGSARIVNVSSGSPVISGMRWSDMTFEKKNKDLPEEEQPMYQFFQAWGYTDMEDKTYIPLDGYNRSKVANVLFGIGANKRLCEKHGVFMTAVHPGVIMTELSRNFAPETLEAIGKMMASGVFTLKTLGSGASTSLVAALDPKLAVGVGETHEGSENYGAFLDDCQISAKARPSAVSSKDAEKLWQLSETLVGEQFDW